MRRGLGWATVLLALRLVTADAGAVSGPTERIADNPIVGRFLDQSDTPLHSYRAVRRLSGANRRYRASGWIEATTALDPVNGLTYEVVAEGGSAYIRNKVLRSVLDREVEAHRSGDPGRTALTADNYEFGEAAPGAGEVRIRIVPRRREPLLVSGDIVLSPHDAELLRVEGDLARSPSFWTRRVFIVRRYGRMNGVRLPVAMSSTVNVLIAGDSSFTMCWDYELVNGMPVVPRISCS